MTLSEAARFTGSEPIERGPPTVRATSQRVEFRWDTRRVSACPDMFRRQLPTEKMGPHRRENHPSRRTSRNRSVLRISPSLRTNFGNLGDVRMDRQTKTG